MFWLRLFFRLCIFGMFWVGLGSFGNQQDRTRCWKPTCSGIFVFIFVVLTFIQTNFESENGEDGSLDIVRAEYRSDEKYIRIVSLILGCIVILLHTLHCVEICSRDDQKRKTILNHFAFQHEVDHKAAIHYKINKMVDNAVDIHHCSDEQNIVKTCFGHALHVYSKWSKKERVGGLVWAWKKILSGDMFTQEGIWYSARLIAANVSQYIVVLYILLAGLYYIRHVQDEVDEEDAKEVLRKHTEQVIWNEFSEGDVEKYSAELAAYWGAFIANLTATGIIQSSCSDVVSSASELLTGNCSTFLGCGRSNNAQFQTDAFCALTSASNLVPEQQMTLMDGAGLDSELILGERPRSHERLYLYYLTSNLTSIASFFFSRKSAYFHATGYR